MSRRLAVVAMVCLSASGAACSEDLTATETTTSRALSTTTATASVSTTTAPSTTGTPVTTIAATETTTTVVLPAINPLRAVSSFEFPQTLGSYTLVPPDGSIASVDEWEFVKDDPTCDPFEPIIRTTADHRDASYTGATPLEVRLVDIWAIGGQDAAAALGALADGAMYTACAVKISMGALPILPPDFTLNFQGEGELPERTGQLSRWLRTELSIPSFGLAVRNDLIFLSAGPVVVTASVSGATDDAEVIAIADDLGDRLDAAVSG